MLSGWLVQNCIFKQSRIKVVVVIATSNTPLNIVMKIIEQSRWFSVLHIALVRIFGQIFTVLVLKLYHETKTQNKRNNLKIIIIKTIKLHSAVSISDYLLLTQSLIKETITC